LVRIYLTGERREQPVEPRIVLTDGSPEQPVEPLVRIYLTGERREQPVEPRIVLTDGSPEQPVELLTTIGPVLDSEIPGGPGRTKEQLEIQTKREHVVRALETVARHPGGLKGAELWRSPEGQKLVDAMREYAVAIDPPGFLTASQTDLLVRRFKPADDDEIAEFMQAFTSATSTKEDFLDAAVKLPEGQGQRIAVAIDFGKAAADIREGDVLTGLAEGAATVTAKWEGRFAAGLAKAALFYFHPAAMIFAVIDMVCDKPDAPEPTPQEVIRDAAMNSLLGGLFDHAGG
jgi:hypothetical protein